MTVTFSGGTGPYQVSLDGGAFAVATSPTTFNGLSAILHSVTVKDARSCTAITSQTISQPPLLTASSTKVDVSCNGSSDGSMTVTFGGGTGPYQVSLDGGAFEIGRASCRERGLSAVVHGVTVKEARSCTANTSQTISQPPLLTASPTKVDASCNGSSDGSMTDRKSGGEGKCRESVDGGALARATSRATFEGSVASLQMVTGQ